jgi:hypothetical protein
MVSVAYVDSDGIERSYTIGHEPVLIGREPGSTIQSNDPLVSRRHALMYVDPNGMLFVEDLGSANGVFVGPNRVKVAPVPMGAMVVVGSLRFRRLASAPGRSQPPAPVQEVLARAQTRAVLVVPEPPAPSAPAPAASPGAEIHTMLMHLLDAERKLRLAIEDERDAYGVRLAEVYRELEWARHRIMQLEYELAQRRQ